MERLIQKPRDHGIPAVDEKIFWSEHKFGDFNVQGTDAKGGQAHGWKFEKDGELYFARELTLHASIAEKDRYAGELKKSAEMQQLLDHPGIPKNHGIFEMAGKFWTIDDYLEGPTLHELTRDEPLQEGEVRELAYQLLDILNHVHQHQIIHRDINPANIKFSDGRYKLIDFGIAKRVEEKIHGKDPLSGLSMSLLETIPMTTLGWRNFTFHAPEQFEKQAVYASDIYGLGLTLIASLGKLDESRQNGFARQSPPRKLQPREIQDTVLTEVINTMIDHDLSKRYTSVEEVLADLQQEPVQIDAPRAVTKQKTYDYITFNEVNLNELNYTLGVLAKSVRPHKSLTRKLLGKPKYRGRWTAIPKQVINPIINRSGHADMPSSLILLNQHATDIGARAETLLAATRVYATAEEELMRNYSGKRKRKLIVDYALAALGIASTATIKFFVPEVNFYASSNLLASIASIAGLGLAMYGCGAPYIFPFREEAQAEVWKMKSAIGNELPNELAQLKRDVSKFIELYLESEQQGYRSLLLGTREEALYSFVGDEDFHLPSIARPNPEYERSAGLSKIARKSNRLGFFDIPKPKRSIIDKLLA